MSDENTEGMYVSPLTRRVATTKGHVIVFKANEPQFVPKAIRPEMDALGILPVDGKMPEELAKKEVEPEPDPVGLERIEKIKQAFTQIIEMDDAGNFTATGVPKTKAVKNITEMSVTSKEIGELWIKYRGDMNKDSEE